MRSSRRSVGGRKGSLPILPEAKRFKLSAVEGVQRSPKEMVRFAHKHGCVDLTARTFTTWVEHGLVAQADRTGRGHRKGVSRTWDESQAQLLLRICRLRQQTERLVVLANIPVGIWLHFGDDVETPQAMTAMRTWANATGSASALRTRRAARTLAEQITGPEIDPPLRNRFVELAAEFAPHTDNFDREDLARQISEMLEASPTPLPVSARGLAALTEVRLLAVRHMNRFAPADFETARANYLTTRVGYQRSPEYDPATNTLNEAMNTACLSAATWLGMIARGFDQ